MGHGLRLVRTRLLVLGLFIITQSRRAAEKTRRFGGRRRRCFDPGGQGETVDTVYTPLQSGVEVSVRLEPDPLSPNN
jgi:hypothetical protein